MVTEIFPNYVSLLKKSEEEALVYLYESLIKLLNTPSECEIFLETISTEHLSTNCITHVLNALAPRREEIKNWNPFYQFCKGKLISLMGEEKTLDLLKVAEVTPYKKLEMMKKTLDYSKVETRIVNWLKEQAKQSKVNGFVIGVSGGVDSAVVSTLAAKTGLPLYAIQMPIHQRADEVNRATAHIYWLMENFPNVSTDISDLTEAFDTYIKEKKKIEDKERQHLAEANVRSRLRMIDLYYYANLYNYLVLGTGNKVEDFGIGFFTKWGDGGVDLSPIGQLMKSEVRALGKHMGVSKDIVEAKPTDGLWDDGRGDEDQIMASYDELEWAMDWIDENPLKFAFSPDQFNALTKRQQEVLHIYIKRHEATQHKMNAIPVCDIDRS